MEHDVTVITARVCTTLEYSGNVSNKSFSCITLSIFETVIIFGLIRAKTKSRVHFLLSFQNLATDFVRFSIAEEAFLIRCFIVTDIPKAQIISTKPELKLGQHHVDGRIVSVHTMSAAFVFARDHLQGLKAARVPWLLVIQTENWGTTSKFSYPLLTAFAIRC